MNRKRFIAAMGLGTALASCGKPTSPRSRLPEYSDANVARYWKAIRDAFPLTDDRVYLNCGGLGPAPLAVLETVEKKARELQSISETGYSLMDQAREVAAAYFNAESEEICFTRNATESNSIIAAGLEMRPGDEVLFESHAHPGGSFPWLSRQKREGIKVKIFEPDPDSIEGSLERIRERITSRTRAIQVSHITAPTGILFDVNAIAKIAQERGIWFHIDGAQSAGMIPVDLKSIDCDSFATSGHKWMSGPRGTGMLYIRKDRIDEVAGYHVGGHSNSAYDLPHSFEFHPDVRRHEYGTRSTELVDGLREAMAFHESIGKERIEAYGAGLANYLIEGLNAIPSIEILTPADPAMRRSITTFRSSKVGFDDLNGRLMRDFRLRCRRVTERGLNAVRVSTHIYNSKEDCDRVIEAVEEIVG